MGWLIFFGYVLFTLPAGRYVGRAVVNDSIGEPDGEDVFLACVLAFSALLVAPLVYIWMFFSWSVSGNMTQLAVRLFGESKENEMKRREREVQDREFAVRKLEQELDLKDSSGRV